MNQPYIGGELELFAEATHWKSYCADVLHGFIRGRVLEVGAGIGSNILYFHNSDVCSWTSLEPDMTLMRRIEQRIAKKELPERCRPITGTIDTIPRTNSLTRSFISTCLSTSPTMCRSLGSRPGISLRADT